MKINGKIEVASSTITGSGKQVAYDDLANVEDITILNKLKNVDGEGSGLDADLFDGFNSDFFADFDAISYVTLLNTTNFRSLYYDSFRSDSLTVESGTASYNKSDTSYTISATSTANTILSTATLISSQTTYYRFLFHIDSTVVPTIQYSTDGSNWYDCGNDKVTYVPSGFTSLQFKFIYSDNSTLNSFGILYNYDAFTSDNATNTKLFETMSVSSDIPAGTNITIPDNGVYTTDGKSLEVYLNRLRMINGIDFNEVDDQTISFTNIDLKSGDELLFVEQYGYSDLLQRCNNLVPSWTENLADYIVLRDQTTGDRYKVYMDNGEIKYEQIT